MDGNKQVLPILAGGGTRLPAHVGILKGLEDLNLSFDHLVGVSGGSIVAALYAAGKPLQELYTLALETKFNQFLGQSLITLISKGGLSTGKVFEEWVDDQLRGICFKDLDTNLYIVASDVATGEPVVFSKQESPDLKVSKAVRFSMSIPIIFSFNEYQDRILVDGSILSEDALLRDWVGDGTPAICFRLRSSASGERYSKSSIPIVNYLTLLIRSFMTTMSREYVHDEFWHNTVVIETGDTSPITFNLSQQQKEALYEIGYRTTVEVVPNKVLFHSS